MRRPKMMGRRTLIAVAAAIAVVATTATAWRLLPFHATRQVTAGQIRTWSRSFALLPPSRWGVGRDDAFACGPKGSTEWSRLVLGFFEVTDTQTQLQR